MNIHANTEPSRLSDEHTVNYYFIFLKGSCTLSCGGGIFSTHAWRLPSVEAVCQMDVVTDTWELVVFFVLFFCVFVFAPGILVRLCRMDGCCTEPLPAVLL